MSLSLRQILYNSDLKSKPVRQNFSDVENFVNDLQDQIDSIITPSTKVIIDSCETISGWTLGANTALSLNSTTYREGSYSINFNKTGTGSTVFEATKAITGTCFDNRTITIWIYTADAGTVSNLNTQINYIDIGTGANFKRFVMGAAGQAFILGWNEISFDYDNPDSTVGSVPPGFVSTDLNVELYTTNAADTMIGKVLLDEIYYGPNDTREVQNARDYHDVLRDRIRSLTKGIGNVLISGGVVSEQGSPDMTVAITAGEAIVDGVGCKWDAQNSGTITAPGSNTRLDYIVVNSDNTISVVAGTAAASPVFPAVASSQLVIGALVVKSTTTTLNDGVEVFNFLNGSNPYFPNVYINGSYTATNKSHNNVICDSSSITGDLVAQGNIFCLNYTANGANGVGETQRIGGSSSETSGRTNTTTWRLINGRGVVLDGTGGSGIPYSTSLGYYGNPGENGASVSIKGFNVYVTNISLSGGDGAPGSTALNHSTYLYAGYSGGHGGNGGSLTIEAVNEIEILSGGSIALDGGDGKNGQSISTGTEGNLGGSGGNAGSGGTFTHKCLTYTNNGTVTYAAGATGSAGVGSGGSNNNGNGVAGSAGSAGSTVSSDYDLTTGITTPYSWIHPLYMLHGSLK